MIFDDFINYLNGLRLKRNNMPDVRLYYTPPADHIFQEMKDACLKLWDEVDTDNDRFGYATEKKSRIKDIPNVGDNFMYMVAMFDIHNQRKLADVLTPEARKEVRDRMVDGGNPSYLIPF